jgi:hypothetical protein
MMAKKEPPWTMSVPAAGKLYYGLSRNASYRAADDGTIPTVRVGRLQRAVVKRLEKMLGDEPDPIKAP